MARIKVKGKEYKIKDYGQTKHIPIGVGLPFRRIIQGKNKGKFRGPSNIIYNESSVLKFMKSKKADKYKTKFA